MLRTFAALVAVTLLAAAPAAAETFHAAPGATNTTPPCPASAPCRLDVAMDAPSTDADDVVLADGTYDLDALTIPVGQGAGSLGPAPGAHPRIVGHETLWFSGTVLHDLTIATQGPEALRLGIGTAERVVVDHDSWIDGGGFAVEAAYGSTLRDSVVIERSDDGIAVLAGAMDPMSPSIVENVTAIATGARGVGLEAIQASCAPYPGRARVRNTIARGAGGDLRTRIGNEDGSCHVEIIFDVDTTNYRTLVRSPNAVNTIVLGPGNQTAPAQTDDAAIFADTVSYRQKDGSPTIDAGRADDDTGTADPDGDLRVTDDRPDIGADEMITRPSGTATLTPLSPTSAILVGAAGAGAIPLTTVKDVYVEIGPTTAYGRQVRPASSLASTGAWNATVTDLPAGALLHYRVVVTATNRVGQTRTTAGADQTVQMPAAPAPPASPPASKPKPLPRLKAATVIKLGTLGRRCSSRRALTLRLVAPKGTKIAKAKITLRGKTTTYSGKKLKARIALRGLPKAKFTVKVKVTLADGRTTTLTKTYKSCSAKRRAKATASSAVATSPA
jgi:hypothetical protein